MSTAMNEPGYKRDTSLVLIFGLVSLGVGLLIVGPGALLANAMATTFVPDWVASVATVVYGLVVIGMSAVGLWIGVGAKGPDQVGRYKAGLWLVILAIPAAIVANLVLIIVGQAIGRG